MAKRLSMLLNGAFPIEEKPPSNMPEDSNTPPARDSPRRTSPLASHSPARLQKSGPATTHARSSSGPTSGHAHSSSAQYLSTAEPTLPSLQQLQHGLATTHNPAEATLLPPPPITSGYPLRPSSRDGSRPSTPGGYSNSSRPATPILQLPGQPPIYPLSPATDGSDKQKKKHWWSKSAGTDNESSGPVAWVAGHPDRLAYDVEGLVRGRPVPELWDDVEGNCTVHLFPRTSHQRPSFKIDSAVFASSPMLTKLAFGEVHSTPGMMAGEGGQALAARVASLSINHPATPPVTPQRNLGGPTTPQHSTGSTSFGSPEVQLFLPIKLNLENPIQTPPTPKSDEAGLMEDTQTLIDYRNLFAFLCGQSLIATERRESFFSIFMSIASIMKSFQFTNLDGSTYGEVASASFDNYVEELRLADVRTSREKTIEGIVLGERMKSVFLYNEAFTHGAGKHEDLLALKNAKYGMITPVTKNRLVRAAMDLDKRTASIRLILTDFDFPFLFSGIMNSKRSDERKEGVRFDQWKENFLGMRKYFMGLYKYKYGDWPPKAKSKKNSLETSGLNRLVLQDIYEDLSAMYDLLVDRTALTTRTIDGVDLGEGRDPPMIRGLRRVLSEYDRSSPPVKPPVPFDLPRLPTLRTTRPDFGTGDAKSDAKASSKKLKDAEIATILQASHNPDTRSTPFGDAFKEMESRAAHGCSLAELQDLRLGQWIFMYVVLQALPMLVCDAPSLTWTEGVEYFLCEPPRGGVPWASAAQRTWFEVGGAGGGVVSLPSDVVEHGVEGIYRRSHCWQMAQRWTAENPVMHGALAEQQQHQHQHAGGGKMGEGLPAPPSAQDLRLRPASRGSDSGASALGKRLSSFGMGLEALPLTTNGRHRAPSPGSRPRTPVHAVDASKTFDAILADVNKGKGKKGKK